ncbi:PadR family transcriptional regulator [Phytohabitans kaempferiae]|uniref:PadR family transcriptional regulator n=1 Tax=Phytohabitans kaempferiae TaxID=1620943 RepID=A0ABV6MI98_9ACTN
MIAAAGPEDAAERRTQLLRGVLDMCLLALLAKAPAHGYELVRRLEAAGFDGVGYGTVYPLLTRMRRLGLVTDEVHASPSGPPRKVYGLTGQGRAALDGWARQWADFTEMINTTLVDALPSTGGR